MSIGPGTFGIYIGTQVAIVQESQVLDAPAIVTQEETGLIESVLAQRIGRGQVLEGRLLDRAEARVVGTRQVHLTIELAAEREQFKVCIAYRADNKLGDGTGKFLLGMIVSDGVCQTQHRQQFAQELFFGR